jgi:hypothetical protein
MEGVLNPFLMLGYMDEGLLNSPGQIYQQRMRVGRSILGQEPVEPLVKLARGVRGVPFD